MFSYYSIIECADHVKQTRALNPVSNIVCALAHGKGSKRRPS